ncbi:hypothetical protein RZS08_07915, partial [Arthrospira platensis SPKY1]|nr:hypothetical protein [Arthrospira platensis SPKY1]
EVGHRDALFAPAGLGDGLLEAVAKERAVGQAGEGVVVGEELELRLVGLLRGDVSVQGHVTQRPAPIVRHRADGEQDRIMLSGLAPVPKLASPEAMLAQACLHRRIELRTMAPRLEHARRAPQDLAARIATLPAEGIVGVDDQTLPVGDQDPFAGVGEHACSQALAGLRPALLGQVDVDAVHLELTVRIALHDVAGEHGHPAAILAQQADLACRDLDAFLDPVAMQNLQVRAHLGRDEQIVQPASKRLLGAEAVERSAGLIPEDHVALGIVALHRDVGDLLEQLAEAHLALAQPALGITALERVADGIAGEREQSLFLIGPASPGAHRIEANETGQAAVRTHRRRQRGV